MPENIAITVDDTTETVSLVVTSGTVDSVFGRTGAVVAVAGDYDTSEVTEVTNLYYTEARVAANSAVALNTAKVTFPEAPNDGTQYARKNLGWEAVAGGGDYADGGEAGGADRTLGNTDSFSLGLLTNNLERVQIEADGKVAVVNTQSATNLEETGLKVTPTINQSGTAAYNGIKVDVTENATGTGAAGDGNNLLNLAVGGVSKFKVGNNGVVEITGTGDTLKVNGGDIRITGTGKGLEFAGSQYIKEVGGAMYFYSVSSKYLFRSLTGGAVENLLEIKNNGTLNTPLTPAYADEAAAVTAGLATGDIYQTTGTAASPLNVAGILMIKQ